MRSFWTVWKSTWDISAASRGSLPASCMLSLLWTQRKLPPPGPALILTANIKRASVEAKTKNRTAQGCWAPVLLSREDQGSSRARDPVWSPCLIMLAFLPYHGWWCQQAVLSKLISTGCPTGLSWSLASGWVQLIGSVGVRLEDRWMEKLGRSLSPASSWFGQ